MINRNLYRLKQYFLRTIKGMMSDIRKQKESKIESLRLRWSFKTQNEKLIIQALNLDDNLEYMGEITANPLVDFQDIKELLNEGQFKIILSNQQRLRVKIGAASFQLVSKENSQINSLKEKINKLLSEQQETKRLMNLQNERILKQGKQIAKLKEVLSQFKESFQNEKTEMKLNSMASLSSIRSENQDLKEKVFLTQRDLLLNQAEVSQNSMKLAQLITEKEILSETVMSQEDKMNKQNAEIQQLKKTVTQLKGNLLSLTGILNKNISNHLASDASFEELRSKLMSQAEQLAKIKFELKLRNQQKPIDLNHLFKQVQSIKWSQFLKSDMITIDGSIAKKEKNKHYSDYALLQLGFSQQTVNKQYWAIKCRQMGDKIYVGICSRKLMQKAKFDGGNLDWNNTGHGCYLIGSSGLTFSHSQKELNWVAKNFQFHQEDVIYMEYDPIKWVMRFRRNDGPDRFEMKINPVPKDDIYHPCVSIIKQNDAVELILPGKPLA